MRRLLDWLLGRRPQPAPVRVRRLTMAEALDASLRGGCLQAVDWYRVV